MPIPSGKSRGMSADDSAILEQYRNLCGEAEAHRAKIQSVTARTREQLEKVTELEVAARGAKNQYEQTLKRQMAGEAEEDVVKRAREDVVNVEADLTEASGTLGALKAELPKLGGAPPTASDVERAKWAAWDAIGRDLKAQVPPEINELAAKIYAATLIHHPDASFSVALTAIFPNPAGRKQCSEVAIQLAKEYNIPM